jgi:ketosteroid isomerase-like protein
MGMGEFEQFFEERAAAAASFVNGDAAPIVALLPKEGLASFHSPGGETLSDSAAVADAFAGQAAPFRPGSSNRFDILQRRVSGDLAFWTGFQIALAHIQGQDQPREMRIRVTEVFQRLGGEWKLIHRHADFRAAP